MNRIVPPILVLGLLFVSVPSIWSAEPNAEIPDVAELAKLVKEASDTFTVGK